MKIGILSAAHVHTESYVQHLRSIPGVEVAGVADEDTVRGELFARQFGAPLFPSYEALLDAQPAAVVICSENSKHRPLVEMAAAAGAHVLCEKPLATTREDGQAVVEACARAGVALMTAFPMRFNPPIREVKALIDAGGLGRIYCFNGTNQGEMPGRHRQWFVDPELAGGGAVMDHTVHLADIMRWYLNSDVVEVYAQTNKIFHAAEVEVETGGLLMLTFANGVFATIDCSWSKPDFYPTWGGLTFELVTERGAVHVDAFSQNLTVYNQAVGRPTWAHWGSNADRAMLEEFISAIREGRPPSVSGLDGYRALEVALAAYESAKTGLPVPLLPTSSPS
jgi:predicted dehydrogenase